MARKKKTAAAVEIELTNVRVFKRDARYLLTILPSDAIWTTPGEDAPACRGALVRLMPPHFVEDDAVAGVVEMFRQAGAAKAILMPRENPPAVVPAATVVPAGSSPRQVVLAMADEARVEDKSDLRSYLEVALDEAGA